LHSCRLNFIGSKIFGGACPQAPSLQNGMLCTLAHYDKSSPGKVYLLPAPPPFTSSSPLPIRCHGQIQNLERGFILLKEGMHLLEKLKTKTGKRKQQ